MVRAYKNCKNKKMKKSKAVTIDGHLVKIDSDGLIFRLNGTGVWNQISNVELFNLINEIK